MEKKMETTIEFWVLGFSVGMEKWKQKTETTIGFRVQGEKGGMDKKMTTTILGSVGITIRIHSFIPSQTLNPGSIPSFLASQKPA